MKRAHLTKRLTALFLAVLMSIGSWCVVGATSAAAAGDDSLESLKANMNAQSYTSYYEGCVYEHQSQLKSPAAIEYLKGAGKNGVYTIPVNIADFSQSGTEGSIAVSDVETALETLRAQLNAANNEHEREKLQNKIASLESSLSVNGTALGNLVYLPEVGSAEFTVEIAENQAGFYHICIEYYSVSGTTSAIERMLYLDGNVPFSEARALSLSKQWTYKYATDGNGQYIRDEFGNYTFATDMQGNSVRPSIEQVFGWRTYECSDSDGFVMDPFEFYFTAGTHTIALEGVREDLVIRSITLTADNYTANVKLEDKTVTEKIQYTYAEYLADINASSWGRPTGAGRVSMQAEVPYLVSDSSVYSSSDRSSAITTPSRPDAQLLNVLGKSSYDTIGQWAAYEFDVQEDGMYQIVMRYRQTALEGMFVSRTLLLWSSDGEYGVWTEVATLDEAKTYKYYIEKDGAYLVSDGTPALPFAEAQELRFNYNKDWVAAALTDGRTNFEFLFKEGVDYSMTLAVSLGQMADILSAIEKSLSEVNNCYLRILQLTGPDPDEYRDYNFSRVMPDVVDNLNYQAKALTAQVTAMEETCGSSGSNTASLMNVARLLEKMNANEDEIASNLENLKSYIGTLGTWINTAKRQSVTMDTIGVQTVNDELPRANANFFQSAWFEIKSFFASFYVDYDSMGVMEEIGEDAVTIDVWLATGRDQSQIWKNLLDNYFTPTSNIAVNLKLVAANTLLPSVLAGQGPDSYIGLASSDVINYAIRGAVLPIREATTDGKSSKWELEGYSNLMGYDYFEKNVDGTYTYYQDGKVKNPDDVAFNAACMIPISLYDKTYGIPETASVSMMFYRQDILLNLGMSAPQTWDDVLSAIPVLQANNMQIGLGYQNAINMFLYQYGSSLWKYEDETKYDPDYAGAQINLDSPEALDSFNFCCRLYTDYSFPYAFDGPNRFRTGEMPILIADYVTTYNQLVVFATEIKNRWTFTSVPGVRDDATGIINNQSIVTVTATVMLAGCADQESTWEYMKWQGSGEMQGQYGNEMVALVGPAAKYATANIEGIKNLTWTAAERNRLMEQFQNMAAIPNYPGSYIIARYTQFAFLAAYNDNEDPTDAMEQYISVINQELTRKRQEFKQPTLEEGQEAPPPADSSVTQ